jgi:hypothetical protein
VIKARPQSYSFILSFPSLKINKIAVAITYDYRLPHNYKIQYPNQ